LHHFIFLKENQPHSLNPFNFSRSDWSLDQEDEKNLKGSSKFAYDRIQKFSNAVRLAKFFFKRDQLRIVKILNPTGHQIWRLRRPKVFERENSGKIPALTPERNQISGNIFQRSNAIATALKNFHVRSGSHLKKIKRDHFQIAKKLNTCTHPNL